MSRYPERQCSDPESNRIRAPSYMHGFEPCAPRITHRQALQEKVYLSPPTGK